MKTRYFAAGALMGAVLIITVSVPSYSQAQKDAFARKQAQAEVAADSNAYVIGTEDALYIDPHFTYGRRIPFPGQSR